ncbi:hypothetical protein LEP1GSC040_3970 [Leptospira santarosai str. 2000030832]|nr:hypothetical protein LEP1GSC040_3970 [Leptospira santarosai str. 2000030832]
MTIVKRNSGRNYNRSIFKLLSYLIEHLDQKSIPKPEKNKFERIKYLE